jgi:hypothetical protein
VGPGTCSYSSTSDDNHPWVQQAAERTQLMVDTGTVSFPIPVDVLPALAHQPFNNPVLNLDTVLPPPSVVSVTTVCHPQSQSRSMSLPHPRPWSTLPPRPRPRSVLPPSSSSCPRHYRAATVDLDPTSLRACHHRPLTQSTPSMSSSSERTAAVLFLGACHHHRPQPHLPRYEALNYFSS